MINHPKKYIGYINPSSQQLKEKKRIWIDIFPLKFCHIFFFNFLRGHSLTGSYPGLASNPQMTSDLCWGGKKGLKNWPFWKSQLKLFILILVVNTVSTFECINCGGEKSRVAVKCLDLSKQGQMLRWGCFWKACACLVILRYLYRAGILKTSSVICFRDTEASV